MRPPPLPVCGCLPENLPGASVSVNQIGGVAVDVAGNVFLSLPQYAAVMRLDATTGILTRVAGNASNGFSGDNGPAVNAQLYGPTGLAVDPAGNLYIADTNNRRIRKVSNGIITTVAGNADEPDPGRYSFSKEMKVTGIAASIYSIFEAKGAAAFSAGVVGTSIGAILLPIGAFILGTEIRQQKEEERQAVKDLVTKFVSITFVDALERSRALVKAVGNSGENPWECTPHTEGALQPRFSNTRPTFPKARTITRPLAGYVRPALT
jgi:hypothetical protein